MIGDADIETPGAYAWWYFDAISADGRDVAVVIFFIGSVFSPHYAERIARGENPRPTEHVAVNVALYREGRRRLWAFNEYGQKSLASSHGRVRIGRSHMTRSPHGTIDIHVDEPQLAGAGAIVGDLSFAPIEPPFARPETLAEGHTWRCAAPRCAVRASFASPLFELAGTGYHDTNEGHGPPGRAIASWSWARAHATDGTHVIFDVADRAGLRTRVELHSSRGRVVSNEAPRPVRPSLRSWLLPLPRLGITRRLELSPFYLRYLTQLPSSQGDVVGVAEHIDFGRFESPIVQRMIGYRMARFDGTEHARRGDG